MYETMNIINAPVYLESFEYLIKRKASEYLNEDGEEYRLDDGTIHAMANIILYGSVYSSLELPKFSEFEPTGNNEELFEEIDNHLLLVKSTLNEGQVKKKSVKDDSKSKKASNKKSRR
jgi:hypothetical protein